MIKCFSLQNFLGIYIVHKYFCKAMELDFFSIVDTITTSAYFK